ncbi:hypothetical protein Micbo1qcDRAFT_229388 [Microdochium bolleyi]|uniref:Uncharacterized protein n=1 Tax=Microdochium bolleyi TaxID=196109 RepID=A0A136JHD8_9PEZI|nr:hypothetical protein Micbo1qcDRAFT_229388 [Microdochium bolleyi]
MAPTTLRSVISPELLRGLAECMLPYSTTEPIDFAGVIGGMFGGARAGTEQWETLKAPAWTALKALSELGIDNVPDFSQLLPAPTDSSFPVQAMGLVRLLDQVPRRLCRGLDSRYTDAYFAVYALQLFRYVHDGLPEELRPTSWSRWKDDVSFDYFILVRMAFHVVLVHNESTAKEAVAFTEATRVLVEERYGVQDAYRDQPDKRWDLYGFPEMIAQATSGNTPASPMGVADGWFHLALLLDVHYPILEKFGRYPYRNGAMGRLSTPEEEEWNKEAAVFPSLPLDIKNQIREDVLNGRWTPLGEEIRA